MGPGRRRARSYAMDGAWDVAADGDRFVLSGFFRKPVDIDEDGSLEPTHSGSDRDSDLAILSVGDGGQPMRAWTAPGPGNDQARAAVFLPDQPVLYVVGFVQLTADFTGNGEFEEGWIRCDALGDLFIARYRLDDAECRITLEGEPRRDGDLRLSHLTWSGAAGAQVEIHRDGRLIATTANDGAYTDRIAAESPGPFRYQVFEAGSRTCSASVTIDF